MQLRVVLLVALCLTVPVLGQDVNADPLVDPTKGGTVQFQNQRSYNVILSGGLAGGVDKIRTTSSGAISFILNNAYMEVPSDFSKTNRDVIHRGDPGMGNGFVDYNLREDIGELRLLGTQPTLQITRFSYPNISIIFDPATNPLQLPGQLEGMNNLFYDANNQLEIVTTSQTKIVAINSTNYAQFPAVYENITNIKTNDAAYDVANNILYFASSDSRIIRVALGSTPMDTSTWVTTFFPLVTTTDAIRTVNYDPVTHMLYAATAGNETIPSVVYFVNVGVNGDQFDIETRLVLHRTSWDVSEATLDTKGILYLTTLQSPPSIIQVSTVPWWRKYEGTEKTRPNSGVVRDIYYDPNQNRVYLGCQNANSDAIAYQYDAAGACENNCYGHGTCALRNCTCEPYTSPRNQSHYWEHEMPDGSLRWCSTVPCDSTAEGVCNGANSSLSCFNGTCTCDDRWTGVLCDTRQCPKNCTDAAKGFCQGPDSGFVCSCSEGWTGQDCAASTFLRCASYATCDDCLLNPGCGWCAASSRCMDGNEIGPLYGNLGCRAWHFRECPGAAINIGSIVVAAVVGLMFFLNAFSFFYEDTSSKDNLQKRTQWYRFQRSSKAYAAWFQLQFYAVATILGSNLPTSFLSFTRIWLPLMGIHGYGVPGGPRNVTLSEIGIALPPENPPSAFAPFADAPFDSVPSAAAARSLLNVDQAMVWADSIDDSIFLSVLATWLVFTAGLIVLYLLVSVILCAVRGNVNRFVQLLTSRPIYIFMRTTELAYFAIVTFSAVQMTRGDTSSQGMVAVAAIFFIVIGILYPAGLLLLLKTREPQKLFSEAFTLRLYPFYGTLNHKKLIWAILPWAKKFLLGCVWGFGNRSMLVQLILSLIILAAYFVGILMLSPYTDYLQQILDIVSTALMFVSVLPLFAFVQTVFNLGTPGVTAATILFMIFSILAILSTIVFYIYSWCQMRGIFSLNQCKKCLSCSD